MTPEITARSSARLNPCAVWTVVSEAPLKGCALAREAGLIFAWDHGGQLYLLDLRGDFRSVARAAGDVVAAVISDDGSRIALLGEKSRLWLLDADLGIVADRQGPPEAIALAIDPHGRYVVLGTRPCANHVYNCFGKPAGKFESLQPLAFLAFVPGRPVLVAAAAYGMLTAYDIAPQGAGRLRFERDWEDRQISGVGRLTTTGDGAMILASCFAHGVQRYDVHGQNDGAYHLGGTATHAVPDYAGRVIAVATLEGELAIVNAAGNVRWRTSLPGPAIALEVDPLGRYVIYGHASGELVRLDLFSDPENAAARQNIVPGARPPIRGAGGGTVRRPDWALPVASSDAQAESTVVAVLDEPPRVAVFSSNTKLQLVSGEGQNLGFAPEILGVGRILRTSPGWVAAATDRQIVLFQAARNLAQRVDLSLVEVTHLAIRPDTFGLFIVQERDRIGRATLAGRWIWKSERKSPIEEIAIGPEGHAAITDDAGFLTILDPAGATIGSFQAGAGEPLGLIEAVDDAPPGVVWMTHARRAQVLRGHDLKSRVVWESPVTWEAWRFVRLGAIAVISAPDGRALAYDGAGHLRGQSRATDGARDEFGANARGEPRRLARQGVHLICSDFDGKVRWRAVCDAPIGPLAVGSTGVAALIGRSLAWFGGLD